MNKNDYSKAIQNTYIYGYPIMGMYDLLYKQVLDPATKTTKMNEYLHIAVVSSPKTTFVPAPNNDTTYSRAWLDLRNEPVILETPDTKGRYFTIQLCDLFTDTTANLGKRLYGTEQHRFAIVGPTWKGELKEGLIPIYCNTTIALAFLRILINGENDLDEVKELQSQFLAIPYHEYIQRKENITVGEDLPVCKMETPLEFFETLNQVLALTPMLKQDEPIFDEMKILGVGRNLDLKVLKTIPAEELKKVVDETVALIDKKGLTFGENVNYWRIARKDIGVFKTNYLQRSVVWFKGALANVPEESLYPSTFQSGDGEYLNGINKYILHFEPGKLPPVSQFWSLTMYRFSDAMLTENEINRYSFGDRTKGMILDDDGGLTITIQHEKPTTEKGKANWLPAPSEPFYMTLRLYGPSSDAVEGIWTPPAVERI
ncbi:DUF1254 domain-containing protein [Anaerorhabdus sp.]|uniref:DUF1254 domain-containing protein n=1 Tax=Anaerorhabdus sp. TaxID=1872524 RepID=UPI002B20F81D|nr:DUF1254 domain-containing protein [Anaerorhabdus sp.]MEA4874270.1 DUF1214 domain-containing protein [Anaerorhabdus sp.]